MKARPAAAPLALAIVLALAPLPGMAAKDCRSLLSSSLNTVGSTGFSWSLEMRGFYYGVDSSSYTFPGLGTWLRYEPSDRWSFDVEAVYREKKYLDYDRDDLPPVQLKTALLRYRDPGGRFDLSLGRQEVLLADGLVLDDFLDAAVIDWRSGAFEVRAGAGVLALSAARESLSCIKCLFFEYRSCWKGFGESAYGDFKTGFVQASAGIGPAGTVGILYQKVAAPDPAFSSDLGGVFGRLSLPLKWRLSFEAAAQRQALHDTAAFGFHLDLYRNWRIDGLGAVQLRIRDLYGSRSGSLLFAPTFGNIHLGDRQHYSVRQGHTLGAGLRWTPAFYKAATLTAGYAINGTGDAAAVRTDEFDAGLEWRPFNAEWGRLYLGYARAVTRTGLVHQLAMEIRITL